MLNLLKKMSYFDIDADMGEIMHCFLQGKPSPLVPGDVVDLVVKQDGDAVLVIRLDFLNFRWELLRRQLKTANWTV